MFSQCGLWALCQSLGLLQVISASPLVAPQSDSTCSARNLAIVKRTISDEVYFCKWWQADTRTRTPFLEFTVHEVDALCKCISPIAKTTSSKHKRAEPTEGGVILSRSASSAVCSAEVSRQFTEPWHFCTFFNAYPRTTSPFKSYNAKDLETLCDCVLGKSVPSSSKKTSTSSHKTSTTSKKSTQTSTRLSSSTKKSSSSRKASSTSHTTSSSSSKATSTSSKLTHSSTKSSSSAKPTSSTQKPSTSLKASSNISKTTSTSSRATTTSTPKSASSRVTTSSLVSSKMSSSISLPSLSIRTSSSTSTTLSLINTSSSGLISPSAIGTNLTAQVSSSTVSSSIFDGLPTIAASSTSAPESTATTTSCYGLGCVSLAVEPSTTSTIEITPAIVSSPTESPDQPTTTETTAIETSLPTTTTSTSSACTPLQTSCYDSYFTLMAVSSDLSINGTYAGMNYDEISMFRISNYQDGFCLDNNNALVWAVTDGYPAVKSTSSGPIQLTTQGIPLTCTATPNEDCTATLSCTWYNDNTFVVDRSTYPKLYLVDDQDTDYGGTGTPIPISLLMQQW